MTFPDRIKDINTNLSRTKLLKIIRAIKDDRVTWGNRTKYGSCGCVHFVYKKQKFEVIEWFDIVRSIYKVKELND